MDLSPPGCLVKPIDAAANATLTFSIADSGGSIDAATGNYIPSSSTVAVSCYVRQASDNASVEPGINENTVSVVVWFTSPTDAPTTIKEGMKVDAVVDGISGVIEFKKPLQHPLMQSALTSGAWRFKASGRFRRED